MKTKEALQVSTFLQTIAKDCKGKLGYAVARNIRLLNTELTEFNNERNELIKKYGTEKDGQIIVENGTESYFKFLEEIKEFEDIDINVDLMKVDEEVLSNSDLDANTMVVLMDYMIKDGE